MGFSITEAMNMGSIFSSIMTPEEEKTFVEQKRKDAFPDACRTPVCWLVPACRHKHAADILYQIAHEANARELARNMAEMQLPLESRFVGTRVLEGQELLDSQLMDLWAEYFLLVGYAIECVLKGYLLALMPDLVKDGKRLDKVIQTHDLCQLCHDCAIDISSEEKELLELITRYIVWGKYAAPLRVEDMPSWARSEDQKEKSLSFSTAHLHDRRFQKHVDSIFQRGLTLLKSGGEG